MRARRAWRAGNYDAVLALLEDPLVRDDRRAQDLRHKVCEALCERAGRRIDTGRLELARHDLDRVRGVDEAWPALSELEARLRQRGESEEERGRRRDAGMGAFERAFEEGRLGEAREALRALDGLVGDDERAELEARLVERRKAASRQLGQVRAQLTHGLEREARESLHKARRLCADSVAFRERVVALSAHWAEERWEEVRRCLAEGHPLEAARVLAEWWEGDPESDNLAEAKDLLLGVADKLAAEIRETAEAGRFDDALVLACRAPAIVAKVPALRRLRQVLERLDVARNGTDEDPRRRLGILARLASETRWPALADERERLAAEAGDVDQRLEAVRRLLREGDPVAGRRELEALLDRWPGCEEARALRDGLQQDEEERTARLEAARSALREGRVAEAQRILLGLVAGGARAEEARGLLRDVERILARIQREVLALEARFEAGEGPAELLPQLERLRTQQGDAPELDDLERRLKDREAREEREGRVRRALARLEVEPCLAALREWIEEGGEGQLLAEDRRALGRLGAEVAERLREALAEGHPQRVLDLGQGLRTWEECLGIRLDDLLAEASRRVEGARARAIDGLAALERRDVEGARGILEEARLLAPGEPTVLRLAHRLESLRRDKQRVAQALELVDEDRDGARRELEALGPTPRPLASMVLELKDRLDRGGDLETGFKLQVEESGEYLVLCEDRLRIGNATGQGFPQIPVLARIKAHHATLERRVSFHGGVQDAVVPAEGCELELDGRRGGGPLSHGARMVLAGILPIGYTRPCPRSVTAQLRLERDFECRGTTRVLWMKQGGKDGRIVFGRGREVHVRVPHAEPELYVYAPGPGRLRVFFDGKGEVDGRAFQGEAELEAGSAVRCGEIAFRVLPL
ncbi:MAG: hypothetical protein R3F30_03685 [Planctomycetota bacterium]